MDTTWVGRLKCSTFTKYANEGMRKEMNLQCVILNLMPAILAITSKLRIGVSINIQGGNGNCVIGSESSLSPLLVKNNRFDYSDNDRTKIDSYLIIPSV